MSRALVTGAAGFLARHLIPRLARRLEVDVIGADCRPLPRDVTVDRCHAVELTDGAAVAGLVDAERPELVFHLAGRQSGDPAEVFAASAATAACLLDAVRRHAPRARVVMVGSAAEYGPVPAEELPVTELRPCRPSGAYGLGKHAATLAALDAARTGLRVVVARPFNLVGAGVPRSLVLGAVIARTLAALASDGEPTVRVGDLDGVRDFIAVDDVADALVTMVEADLWGEVFNLCTSRPLAVRALVEMALGHAPRPVRLEHDPELTGTSSVTSFYGSFAKAGGAFGFSPTVPIEQAIAAAWRHAAQDAS